MPDSRKTFYVTTPIYYVNARPHIGHAYTTIVADVLARRHRLLGDDTFFLTGTDEHGQKIERSAAAAGIPPQQFADQVSKTFSDLWARMGITHNDYIRTTEPRHKLGAQKLFRTLYERGFIYLASYTGSYCVSDEAFIDAPIGTPCPDCGRLLEEVTEENFFFRLSRFQAQLIDLIHLGPNGEPAQIVITPDSSRNEVLAFLQGNAFDLERHSKQKDNLERQQLAIKTIDHLLQTGILKRSANGWLFDADHLRDLSISRSSFTWGIPVPPEIQAKEKTAQKHVIYVWLDALANYMTALGYGSDDTTLFQKFWPADLHLVGKEITRFHCIYWPAFLLAAGLPLPKQITAHGWLLFDNSKMSKSKGNIVRTETILDAFGTLCPPTPLIPTQNSVISTEAQRSGETPVFRSPHHEPIPPGEVHSADNEKAAILSEGRSPQSKDLPGAGVATNAGAFLPTPSPKPTPHDRDLFAADILRYYLLREIPFGQDGSFSFDALITRYNADLANGYGNLVSRTLNMVNTNFEGTIPDYPADPPKEPQSLPLSALFEGTANTTNFLRLLSDINGFIGVVDGRITSTAPWKLAKSSLPEDRTKLKIELYTACEAIRVITAYLYPILPYATARVWAQLGLGDIEAAAREGKLTNLQWGGLRPGTKLGPLGPIFPRADKGLAQIMTDLENPTPAPIASTDPAAAPRTTTLPEPGLTVAGSHATTTGPEPLTTDSPQITIDDFAKIDLRVAQITLAERIPKADKLLRLEVDLGPLGRRQILSGIAEFYTPEELLGRRIVVITNLAPRKMRGLESHGMLLAASEGDHGKPQLATCGDEIALGSRLK